MNEYVMVSVRDAKSETFGRPFCMLSIGQAIRSFDDEVNRVAEDNIMNQHPEDFSLYQVGTFEDEKGMIRPISPVKLLIHADQVKKGMLQSPHISKV